MSPKEIAPETLIRKLRYVTRFASIEGLEITSRYWASVLEYIHTNIGANILFRFILDMYLALSAHLDPSKFEFHPIEFIKAFVEVYEPRPFLPPKGKIPNEDIERMIWFLRWRMTTKEAVYYNMDKGSAKYWAEYIKNILIKYGADPIYAQLLLELYSICEGKLTVSAIVGLAVVGVTKVAPPTFKVRIPPDYTKTIECENAYIYESHVGIARVGYSRVIELPGSLEEFVAEHISSRIAEHIKRQSVIASSPEYVFYPRVFFYQRLRKMHYTGGGKQLELQRIRNLIKPILDRNGVIAQFRVAYLNFAYELKYKDHMGHEHTKYFKRNLTKEDLINKYVNMGLSRPILNQIAQVVMA